MTHTLHRVGDQESLEKEYIVYMTDARGINDKNSADKLKRFVDICAKHSPINIGCAYPDAELGSKGYHKGDDLEEIRNAIIDHTQAIAIYDSKEKLQTVIEDLKEADLGLSVIISGTFDQVDQCCKNVGVTPHTVNLALGIWGKTDRLPPRKILDVVTMCGHGLISRYLVEDLVRKVKRGIISAEDASKILGRNCVCGAFNNKRAAELITEIVVRS